MKALLLLLFSAGALCGQWAISSAPYAIAYFGTNAPAGGGGSLILTETFDTVTGYDNTWSETGSGINEDYTVWTYQGAQSLNITNAGGLAYTTVSTAQRATNFCAFVWKPWLNNGTMYFTLATLGSADRGRLFLHAGLSTWKLEHGSAVSSETVAFSMGTVYYVWIEYVNGTGSDGIMNGWVRTSTAFPGGTPDLTITAGTSTTQPNGFGFVLNNNEASQWDYLRVWNSRPSGTGADF